MSCYNRRSKVSFFSKKGDSGLAMRREDMD